MGISMRLVWYLDGQQALILCLASKSVRDLFYEV